MSPKNPPRTPPKTGARLLDEWEVLSCWVVRLGCAAADANDASDEEGVIVRVEVSAAADRLMRTLDDCSGVEDDEDEGVVVGEEASALVERLDETIDEDADEEVSIWLVALEADEVVIGVEEETVVDVTCVAVQLANSVSVGTISVITSVTTIGDLIVDRAPARRRKKSTQYMINAAE